MKQYIKDKLNPHLYTIYPSLSEEGVPFEFDPIEQIWNIKRFDLAVKYVYLLEKNKGIDSNWFEDIYYEHIKAFSGGTFKEGDGEKYKMEDFLDTFRQLERDIANDKFLKESSLIPFKANSIIDGSHRVSTAAFFGKKLMGVELNQPKEPNYNHEFFERQKQPQWINDYTYLSRIMHEPEIRIIHVNPKARISEKQINEILKKYNVTVEYSKAIKFTGFAFGLVVREYYKQEKWIGNYKNKFAGALEHSCKSYSSRKKLRVYFVKNDDLEILNKIKSEIREVCKIGNYSVHINDTYGETLRLAPIFLNYNCIDFLNSCLNNNCFWKFDEYIHNLKLKFAGIDTSKFMFVGSIPLTLIGLRNNRDIDIITESEEIRADFNKIIPDTDTHNQYLNSFGYKVSDLLYDPRNFFIWQGLKFWSIEGIWALKKKRSEFKDKVDFLLFHLARIFTSINYDDSYRKLFKLNSVFKMHYFKGLLKRIIIRSLGNEFWLKMVHFLSIRDGKLKFKNNILYYPKGYTIIQRYIQDGNYEPQLIDHISSNFKLSGKINVIDVGANIGLLSSLLLNRLEIQNLYMFEPGPHQLKYLKKSFKDLHFVKIYENALGSSIEEISFYTHHPIHTSGDGIINTGRAGNAKKVIVKQLTLDKWWEAEGKPQIDLLKIDVEGYEYEVIRGAESFIKAVKPLIYLEINLLNLKNQKHSLLDLLKLTKSIDYEIFDLNGKLITLENDFENASDDNFYARPRTSN